MIISFKDYELTGFEIIPTREKKGNYIYIPYHENINKKVKQLYFINKLMLKYTSVYFLMHVKETIFDRLKEFFTGYYRNPIKDLFEFKNIRKIRYLIRDYREK